MDSPRGQFQCTITDCYGSRLDGSLVCGLHEGMLPVPVKILLRNVNPLNEWEMLDAVQRARSWVITTRADELRWSPSR